MNVKIPTNDLQLLVSSHVSVTHYL